MPTGHDRLLPSFNQSDEGLNYHDIEGHGAGSLRSAEVARLSTEVNR